MGWFVYILECQNNFLYTGITNDLDRRFTQHQNKSAHFTSYNPPKRFVFIEPIKTRGEALSLEAQIKKLPKKIKLQIIGQGG